ncbi:penicillin-binding protein [Aureibacter tunicatorum]|uniref:Cell division protein FtsI (Penicillin-binding protein 3) n=1 Tax=Aureibacter tunicatorum TaxID=866807 RepID=A0AAE3XRA8_9BACT|nr:penicillin-binding protein [Aureibacter tunicatorum]MDR6241235.1 cell division protein FtsI (penicillin-binding protein 3) [Aureibacter tunicatorum]BDD03495.1 penicillin-binding protein [Aureibacter tunicatorum]
MNIKKSILFRSRLAFLFVLLFAVALIYRIVAIQFVEGEKWIQKADQIGLKHKELKATRGNIYSDNGSLMATSLPFYKVAFDPTRASDEVYKAGIDTLSDLLSKKFGGKSANGYRRMINDARKNKSQYIVLSRKLIDHLDKKEVQTWPILKEGRMKGGVIFEKVNKRFLPFNDLARRTIGFVNENYNGAGLEYSFNDRLAGENGQALYRKISGGRWRPVHDESEVRPVNGFDIETTIDINLQDVAQSALKSALQSYKADYGCAVVMEVKTGEIKAMTNLSYDEESDYYYENYNFAVGAQGLTEPGSTFKLASMIALFEESNLDIDDKVQTGDGEYEFYDKIMRDHKPGGYGELTVKDAFAKSSNIAISKLVNDQFGLTPERFINYIKDMGLLEPLGFQMVGEGVPYIKSPDDKTWSGVTLPWMSIGYELKLTPLHVLAFYNAVANNGRMVRPMIVKRVFETNREIQTYKTEVIKKKICSDATLSKVRELLVEVVETGTAKNIKNDYYKIAGKTGTAQKVINRKYTKKYYTSFAGFFPAESPKYSCIVVIDKPTGGQQYGSDAAAPVFKEIADKIYSTDLNLHKAGLETQSSQGSFPVIKKGLGEDLKFLCNELGISNHMKTDDEWVKTRVNNNAVEWVSNRNAMNRVPDVRGMTLKDAMYLLENAGLRVVYKGTGRVETQSIVPGDKIKIGTQIFLKLKFNDT